MQFNFWQTFSFQHTCPFFEQLASILVEGIPLDPPKRPSVQGKYRRMLLAPYDLCVDRQFRVEERQALRCRHEQELSVLASFSHASTTVTVNFLATLPQGFVERLESHPIQNSKCLHPKRTHLSWKFYIMFKFNNHFSSTQNMCIICLTQLCISVTAVLVQTDSKMPFSSHVDSPYSSFVLSVEDSTISYLLYQ